MTFLYTKIKHKMTKAEKDWLAEEIEDQEKRYNKIRKQMKDLEPKRKKWYAQFLARIQSRGFNFDGDQRMKIKPEDIPVEPKRKNANTVIWKYGVEKK